MDINLFSTGDVPVLGDPLRLERLYNVAFLLLFVVNLFIRLAFFKLQSAREEPIHILNIAIKTDCDIDDDGLAAMFREFTQSKVNSCLE